MGVSWKKTLRNFVIELVVYGVLVFVYFIVVLRYLTEPLTELFNSQLTTYAILSLILIVAQAVVLEWVTSFLIERLGLERME